MKELCIKLICTLALCTHIINSFEITSIVIPAAGLGTRWLPYTKTFAKEEVPVGNKPAIQFVVEEGISSGIHNFVMIINERKQQLQNYFGSESSSILKQIGKYHLIAPMEELFEKVTFTYVDQPVQRGLGDAILMAQPAIGDNYFGVILPDDLVFSTEDPALAQMVKIAQKEHASVIGVQEVPFEQTCQYGIVGIKHWMSPCAYEISHLVEKPKISSAPSNLAIIGRYILSPKIFAALKILSSNMTSGELQLTDAIDLMMRTMNEKVIAVKIQGSRHDVGTPIGWMKAVVYEGVNNPEFSSHFIPYLQHVAQQCAVTPCKQIAKEDNR